MKALLLGACLAVTFTGCGDDKSSLPPLVLRRLTVKSEVVRHPRFSGDGKKLAFGGVSTMGGYLFQYDFAVDSSSQINSTSDYPYGPDLSPDGSMVAYMGVDGDSTRCYSLFLQALPNGNPVWLGYGAVPALSPDGLEIVAEGGCPNSHGFLDSLQVISLPGDRHVFRPGSIRGKPASPDWSPDGSRLCFEEHTMGEVEDGHDIWICDADGSDPSRLTSTHDARNPSWSPDGQWIAFDSSFGISAVNVSSREIRQLVEFPVGYDYAFPDWSPDGDSIVFARHTRDGDSLWLATNVSSILSQELAYP